MLFAQLEGIARKYEFSLHSPIREIPEDALNTILYGSEELFRVAKGTSYTNMTTFQGVISKIEQNDSDSEDLLERKDRFVEEGPCPECKGTRLKEEALCFMIDSLNISSGICNGYRSAC